MIFKCKICGGSLDVNNDKSMFECEYCGTLQVLPDLKNDKLVTLYDRANHFRRNNEFDKAIAVYEQILSENNTDAEAYWSIVLCRYGIEYVEDPLTHKRIPTINRTQFTSVFDDNNYKSALKYADYNQRNLYEKEAKEINEIQKKILKTSENEAPFDVFICYKESDNSGRRTLDSVLANDMYHQLEQEGFKVFFSRITLEDKLGSSYEPYIFAALNSAKVMVVIGTRPEFFDAVWVKNEWGRYLSLIKNGEKKVLIPAYRDMSPYDLPEEFSHLQAQDMSKLGFMQDLIRGIKKIIGASKERHPEVINNVPLYSNIGGLIERAELLIEEQDYKKATECLELAMNIEPKNPNIYICMLMIEMGVRFRADLAKSKASFESSQNYKKALRFGDDKLKDELIAYNKKIAERIETEVERAEIEKIESLYNKAIVSMNLAKSIYELADTADLFEKIIDYKDSKILLEKCLEQISSLRREQTYHYAMQTVSESESPNLKYDQKIRMLEKAVKEFESILDYKDSAKKIDTYRGIIDTLKIKKEEYDIKVHQKQETIKKNACIFSLIVIIVITAASIIVPAQKYKKANNLFDNKKYYAALILYDELGGYKESPEKKKESMFQYASEDLIKIGSYSTAIEIFDSLGSYKNSEELLNKCYLEYSKQLHKEKKYSDAITYYEKIPKYDTKAGFYVDSCYNYAVQLINEKKYSDAIVWFEGKAKDHKNSKEKLNEAKYGYVSEHKLRSDTDTLKYLKELKAANYKDSASIYKELFGWKAKIIANDSKEDTTTDMSSISKYNNWYFHVTLTGGEPEASTSVKYTMHYPNGDSKSDSWEGEFLEDYSGTCWTGYKNPEYGTVGTLKLEVYDEQNNLVGTKSVQIAQDNSEASSGYLFNSDTEYITVEFLSTKNRDEVRMILNEMYARHGYNFNDEEYKIYFSGKSWYRPRYSSDKEAEAYFNSIEMENKKIITQYEKNMGWR